MITDVKIIQYHLTKLEDAEKELAEVLNSGYTLLACSCSDTYIVWTLVKKEDPAGILVPNPKIISEVDDYSQDGLPEGWEAWEGGENPVPGKWVKYKLRSGAQYADYSDDLDWSHSSLGSSASAYDIVAFQE
ncbi:hypothetical protein [Escherichia coli]|uniref:hypothetical protein n=1 Tax=Escherichia coli TaxID=562 RepID=UPI001FF62D37|nr:hypothetical protein [Escherichia coli]MCK0651329.1 hypothetical protein [Escherichia coli]